MSRRGKIVEKLVLHKYGVSVPVKMVRDDGSYGSGKVWFEAELGGNDFRNENYTELEKAIKAHADILYAAEWKPLIQIKTEATPDDGYSTKMEFSFDRFYYSRVGGYWRKLDWEYYAESKKKDGRYKATDLIGCSGVWRAAGGEGGIPEDDVDENRIDSRDYTNSGKPRKRIIIEKVGTYYRPYTEELWQGLCQLRDMVSRASMKLAEILGSNEGQARIAKGASLIMLTEDAGKKS